MFKWLRRLTNTSIASPKIGILNLIGERASQLISEDKVFFHLFSSVSKSNDNAPICDVLILYADIASNGSIQNSNNNLREIIRNSGAKVVLVASENKGENYIAAAADTGFGRANLVMTLERKGQKFPNFFKLLFSEMMRGTTMPIAWVKLAPQIPGHEHQDCPETIFSCEAGQVRFG